MERLHSPATNDSPDRFLRGTQRCIDRRLYVRVAAFDDDTRQAAEDDLDPAPLVDASAWAVHVGHAHADSFDRRRKLAELHTEFSPDVGTLVVIEGGTEYPQGDRWFIHGFLLLLLGCEIVLLHLAPECHRADVQRLGGSLAIPVEPFQRLPDQTLFLL